MWGEGLASFWAESRGQDANLWCKHQAAGFAWFPACVIFPLAIDFSPSCFHLPHLFPEEAVIKHLAAPVWIFGGTANTFCAELLFPRTTSDFSDQKCKSKQIGTGHQRMDASGTHPLKREMSVCFARLLSGSPAATSPSYSCFLTLPRSLFYSPLSFTPESRIIFQVNYLCPHLCLRLYFWWNTEGLREPLGEMETWAGRAAQPDMVLHVIHRADPFVIPLLPPLGHRLAPGRSTLPPEALPLPLGKQAWLPLLLTEHFFKPRTSDKSLEWVWVSLVDPSTHDFLVSYRNVYKYFSYLLLCNKLSQNLVA